MITSVSHSSVPSGIPYRLSLNTQHQACLTSTVQPVVVSTSGATVITTCTSTIALVTTIESTVEQCQ